MKFRHTLFFQADCTQPELPILRAQRIQQPFHDRLECIGKVFFLHSPGTHNTSKIQTGTSSNHPLANLNPILFQLHIGQQQIFAVVARVLEASFLSPNLLKTGRLCFSALVGEVGVEPTQLESNGFTDRPSSPTLALPYIYYSYIGAGRGG